MTGRLPHRVSDALSTKTDRSYVSPSPKNSLSFQELPHNQSNKPAKTHAETAPDSHPTMGFWPYPYKHCKYATDMKLIQNETVKTSPTPSTARLKSKHNHQQHNEQQRDNMPLYFS